MSVYKILMSNTFLLILKFPLCISVTDAVSDVLGVASPEPGAILYEASEKLVEGTYGVYEYIHMIGEFCYFPVKTFTSSFQSTTICCHDLIF